MKIKEGSQVIIQDLTFNIKDAPVEAVTDIEIVGNEAMMFDGYLCQVDSYNSVIELGNEVYQINVWAKDAILVKDGSLYQSISDVE